MPYNLKNFKSTQKTQKQEKKDENHSFTDDEHNKEILSRPNVSKMKNSLIYSSKHDDLVHALKNLSHDEKAMLQKNVVQVIAELPEPRDGMTVNNLRDTHIVVFGGDRNKFPFNDIFFLDLNTDNNTNTNQPNNNSNNNEV